MEVTSKIKALLDSKGWSVNRLAQETNLTASTIYNWLRGHTLPTVAAIENICAALGITISEFFCQDKIVPITEDMQDVLEKWQQLSRDNQKLISGIVAALNSF